MSTYVPSRQPGNSQTEILELRQGPPAPPPLLLRPVAPNEAVAINRAIPLAAGPNPAAQPFRFRGGAAAYNRALGCLTSAVYYEAASESDEGQQAVAQVVLNRVRHPAFPGSVCAVVFQGSTLRTGCQFTFTCDGSLLRAHATREWARSEAAAAAALAGRVFAPVGNATHYHADFVVPYWATSLDKNQVVGTHIFYRWRGAWGKAAAFRRPYAAAEADPVLLRAIALAARQADALPIGAAHPEPQISVNADPRVELFSIVKMLASSEKEGSQTAFEKDAREYFGSFSDHLAVQIYRQLATEDEQLSTRVITQLVQSPARSDDALKFPALVLPGHDGEAGSGFADALADFTSHTKFAEFFAKQQLYYLALGDAYRAAASPVADRFENYLGAGAGSLRLIVAPGIAMGFVADCSRAAPLVVLPEADSGADGKPSVRLDETEKLLAHAVARRAFERDGKCAADEDQNVAALAGRVMHPGPAKEPRKRSAPGTAIADALETYEQNRKWFPTFASFRPALLESLALADAHAGRLPCASNQARRSGSAMCTERRRS